MISASTTPEVVAERRRQGLQLQRDGNIHDLPVTNLAVLSTFNVDLLPPLLMEALGRSGLYPIVYMGNFGQLAQDVLDESSGLYRAQPDGVVLIPAVEDLLSPLFERPSSLSAADVDQLVKERAEEMAGLVNTLLERLPSATCYVVVFGTDRAPMEHILSPGSPERGQWAVESLEQAVRALSILSPRVVVVDWEWYTRATGTSSYRDERLWYLGRMRLNPVGLASLADLITQHIAANRGLARKVAVVDLDNTLWGGVVGEDGLKGLSLGEEGLGLAFRDFQRELLKLHDTGIVLAICSKNNPEDVWEVFEGHPSMILRREHFALVRINWQDKATNLEEISDELGLGLDSFVFFDDSPVEREWVARAVPEVMVPLLPKDPVDRPNFLGRLSIFSRIDLTEADEQRIESYKASGLARDLRDRSSTIDEFLASLCQEIVIEPLAGSSLARAAQMSQRTNQFNLTTRRYTIADLERMEHDPSVEVYTLAVKDRFVDNGITGLAILRFDCEMAEIDTLLLSCRVLGRKVEDSFLAFLAQRSDDRGADHLIGCYLPTRKNKQVENLYSRFGFEEVGERKFQLDLRRRQLEFPSMISVKADVHA